MKPFSRFCRVSFRALSIHEHGAEIILCAGFTATGGFFEPVIGRFFVFGSTEAFKIDDAHEGLRFDIAAIGRTVEPFGGLHVVLFASLALKIQDTQHGLCLVVAQRCRFFELGNSLFVLSGGIGLHRLFKVALTDCESSLADDDQDDRGGENEP